MASYPSLSLVYFPVRARAECARMILAYGNILYKEDNCNSFFGMSFQEAKKAGKLPFGQLPVLEVGGDSGKLLGQSGSINRYLASLVQVRFFQSVFCCICLKLRYIERKFFVLTFKLLKVIHLTRYEKRAR